MIPSKLRQANWSANLSDPATAEIPDLQVPKTGSTQDLARLASLKELNVYFPSPARRPFAQSISFTVGAERAEEPPRVRSAVAVILALAFGLNENGHLMHSYHEPLVHAEGEVKVAGLEPVLQPHIEQEETDRERASTGGKKKRPRRPLPALDVQGTAAPLASGELVLKRR